MELSREQREQVQQRLLAWYRQHRRDLPWRRNPDPYSVLVSEFLLQQTTVEAAIPYFERFLQRFPTVHDLAAASLDEVLQVWAGLGYYARARNLHETAKRVVAEFGGQVPREVETLLQLPGIGRYTAGAIASIAYNVKAPALDTNAIRVVARLLGWKGNPQKASFKNQLWDALIELLPDKEPGEFNQALMDLAATICTIEAPLCSVCPLQTLCVAFASGTPEQFPTVPQKRRWRYRQEVACVIWHDQKVLVAQRSAGWWQGLWEFPHGEQLPEELPLQSAERLAQELLGLTVTAEAVLVAIKHTVTVHRITLTAVRCRYLSGEQRLRGYRAAKWVSLEEAKQLPSSIPQQRLLTFVEQEQKWGQQGSLF